jgi:8-oxo-dGTP diphosphatase
MTEITLYSSRSDKDQWGVRVIIPVENKGIVLVKHDDQPPFWLFPGGGVESSETLIEAGVREVKEETGLDVEIGSLLYVRDSIDGTQEFYLLASQWSGMLTLGHDPDKASTHQVLADVDVIPFERLKDNFLMYPRTIQQRLVDDLMHGLTSVIYLGVVP